MEKKYFLFWASGSLAETREFSEYQYEEMIECVHKHVEQYEALPTVYYGWKLEFEPAEIVKSWKIKGYK